MVKGLKEYVEKHGMHFTVELAYAAALDGMRWSAREVEKSAQRKVYYNVTGSTLGDMVFLMNDCYADDGFMGYGRKKRCLDYTLKVIGDFSYHGGVLFREWIEEFGDGFDLTPYI